MAAKYLLRQDAANQLGIHFAKLEDLRKRGLIPEAVQIGRYHVFPTDQINAIRERLEQQGHIKRGLAHAPEKPSPPLGRADHKRRVAAAETEIDKLLKGHRQRSRGRPVGSVGREAARQREERERTEDTAREVNVRNDDSASPAVTDSRAKAQHTGQERPGNRRLPFSNAFLRANSLVCRRATPNRDSGDSLLPGQPTEPYCRLVVVTLSQRFVR